MQASIEGLKKIQQALNTVKDCEGKRYIKGNNSNAILAAQIYRIHQIRQDQGWAFKSKLSYQLIQEILVEPGVLNSNPIQDGQTISVQDIINLIEDEKIKVPGVYGKSWQQFYNGENVANEEAFKAYCGILKLNWVDIIADELELTMDQQLEQLLCKFDHQEQRKLALKNSGFYLKCNEADPISFIWLLKCLTEHPKSNNWIPVYLSLNSLNLINLENIVISLKDNLKLTRCNVKRDLINKTIIAIIDKMKKENKNIVLIFQDIDAKPKTYLEKLKQQFWQPLLQQIAEKDCQQKVIMCWLDSGRNQPDWRESCQFNPDILELSLGEFTQNDLNQWFQQQEVKQLLEKLDFSLDINSKVEEIWQNTKGDHRLLLKEIYQLFASLILYNRRNQENIWEEYEQRWLIL
jgi:hypothetical protein